MRCPTCQLEHNATTGRLMALFPTFGIGPKPNEGIVNALFGPPASKDRVYGIINGAGYTCLNCGHPFGIDKDGTFRMKMQPDPPAEVRRAKPEPTNDYRPPHLPEADLAAEPVFD